MVISNKFEYIRPIADRFGNLYFAHEFQEFIDQMTQEQQRELEEAYRTIVKRNDSRDLSRWGNEQIKENLEKKPSRRDPFPMRLGQLFLLFGALGERGIKPFDSGEVVWYEQDEHACDWSILPKELTFLISSAEQYGGRQGEGEIIDFLDNATDDEKQDLSEIARRIRSDNLAENINSWLNRFPLDKHTESAKLYSLMGHLDLGGWKLQ